MEVAKHYILFPSYNSGLALESILKQRKIKYIISPTPRELSTCCGISIIYNKEDEDTIRGIVKEKGISILGFHTIVKEKKNYYLDK